MRDNLLYNYTDEEVNDKVSELELSQWEKKTGYKLPDDYRRFILKYNGGMIKPWLFKHHHPHLLNEDFTIFDGFRGWRYVLEFSEIGSPHSSHPPHYIEIGTDPGGGRVLLSLAKENYSQVVYWLPSYSEWGDELNNVVGIVANSFSEFLDCLYNEAGESDYYNWEVYAKKRTPIPVFF